MTSWCKRVAVLAAWLGLTAAVPAQKGPPGSPGPVPEPFRFAPESPSPFLVPGPVNPIMAPPGPPSTLSLPADHTTAFDPVHPPECAFFAHVGIMSLKRHDLNASPLVFTDDMSGGRDTGILPVAPPTALRQDQVHMGFHTGTRFTLGYLMGNESVEVSGFILPSQKNSITITNQGRLTLPFAYSPTVPIGFEGNLGLWAQADLVSVGFFNTTGNLELNYRWWDPGINQAELLIGLRYFYAQEGMQILTDDDNFTRDLMGRPDPALQAVYTVKTRNNIYAVQVGGEWSTPPIPVNALSWIFFTAMGKAGIGPNFIERNIRLSRGDEGTTGAANTNPTAVTTNPPEGIRSVTSALRLGGIFETATYVDFHFLERLRLRAGYMALLATGVSSASRQIEFNFERIGQRPAERGAPIFWHGPVLELQLLF